MLTLLDAAPGPYFRRRFRVAWGGRQLTVAMVWRQRLQSWYFDLYDANGEAIVLGRRVSPGFAPLAGLALAEQTSRTEVLLVDGPDPYQREDLGEVVRMMLLDLTRYEPPPSDDPNGPDNLFVLPAGGA